MFSPTVKISLGAVAGTPASQQKSFYLQDISERFWEKLPTITQSMSYSAIEFLNNIRKSEYFFEAHMIILDIDDGMTIKEALVRFAPYFGMIATTKSHQKSEKNGKPIVKQDRFRVILFLEKPITDPKIFKTVMTNLITKVGADQACKDLARFYFENPSQLHWWLKGGSYFDITPYMTEVKKKTQRVKNAPSNTKAITTTTKQYVVIEDNWEIQSEDGTTATAIEWREELEIGDKQIVHCPFPEHSDSNPSAFIEKKENGSLFVYCNSCTRKGWNSKQKQKAIIPDEIITDNTTSNEIRISEFSDVLIQNLQFRGAKCKVDEIVDCIISTIIPITSYYTNIYLYVDGFWEKHKNDDIEKKVFVKAAVKKILGIKRPTGNMIESVHSELLYEYLDLPKINSIMINFYDSILMIEDGEFYKIPHDPKYRKLYKLKFPYDESATCPTVDKFMVDVIEEQQAIDMFWEFIGSCFISNEDMKLEKCVMLIGAGANGKSVLLDLIRELLGVLNVSTVSLKDMGNPERRHSMIGKLLNIASEGSANKFDSEDFKAIISREPLPVRQLYNNSVDTNDFPRLIFASNHLPYTGGDSSNGMMRRIEIISFDKIFSENEQDKQLLQKLTPELSGVMNRVLQGMTRLLKNQKLTTSPKVEEAKRMYELQIDPVKFFVSELNILYDETQAIYSSAKLYGKFRDFCKDSGINALNKQNFSKHMSTIYGKLRHSNKLYGWYVIVGAEQNSANSTEAQECPYG
jgi:putative DNA primase/helicase